MNCPDENKILEFVQGTVDRAAALSIETHIDDCETCRLLVSELARVPLPKGSLSHASSHHSHSISEYAVKDGVVTQKLRASNDFHVDQVVSGRYRVARLIGRGAMGTVYEAHDLELDDRVALKMLRPEFTDALQFIQHLKQEMVLGRRITHPNVCRLHDIGVHGGQHFISMTLVKGASLAAHLSQKNPEPEWCINVLVQICEALEAAHRQGVVHRDLKSSNIMVDENGVVTVMDFGLARDLWAEASQSGMLIGSPGYWSPEQACGKRATERSDIFSVGVIALELFGVKRTSFLEQPNLKNVPRRYRGIILRCLAPRPEDRFATARLVRRAFQRAQRGSSGAPPWLWTAIGASALIALCASAVAAFLPWINAPKRPAPRASVAPAPETAPLAKEPRGVSLAGDRGPAPSTAKGAPAPGQPTPPIPAGGESSATLGTCPTLAAVHDRPRSRSAARGAARHVEHTAKAAPALQPDASPNAAPDAAAPTPAERGAAADAQRERALTAVLEMVRRKAIKGLEASLATIERSRQARSLLPEDLPGYGPLLSQARAALDRQDDSLAGRALAKAQLLLNRQVIDKAFIAGKLSRINRLRGVRRVSKAQEPLLAQAFGRVHSSFFSGDYAAANRYLNQIAVLLASTPPRGAQGK